MQKGLIGTIIFFIVIGAAGYFIYSFVLGQNTAPNQTLKDSVGAIPIYENTQTRNVKYLKDICIIPNDPCTHNAHISFSSKDPWENIYFFYRKEMEKYGWQTNSIIVTSIPTSIVFQNPKGCEAGVSKEKSPLNLKSKPENNYKIRISCKEERVE